MPHDPFLQTLDQYDEDTSLWYRRTINRDLRKILPGEDLETFGLGAPQDYKKIAILGRGSSSIIWLAENTTTGDEVALKQIPTTLMDD